ncbi:MAG: trimethylamine methyltransferase family protein [Deltaproteobacteria bacterium]|nr:trimethylamine methyltransferase family protein [Deltaproteobacteria bacterium]
MYSETDTNVGVTSPFRKEILSSDQITSLQNSTLNLLENVGVYIPAERALSIFAEHGAVVDFDKQIVRIPPHLVEKALSSAPRSFVLAGREPRFDLKLDGENCYICTAGTGVNVMDHLAGRLRASTKADLESITRVVDALPMISFMWSTVTSQDYGRTAPLHDCHAMLTNTLKHVRGATTVFPELAGYIVEMAKVVAGGRNQLKKRPPINANICTIAPMSHDKHGIECALTYAEAGIPVSFMAMTTMFSTAPASPLAALVIGDAEVVSGMVLLQLAYPGTPVFHAVFVSMMDPRTGGYIAKVPLPLNMMAVELGHAWNVPCLGGTRIGSDAHEIGWQSGMEGTTGAMNLALCGAEVGGSVGLLSGAMDFWPEQLILDHEICRTTYDLTHGFDFDAYDIPVDVIQKAGHRGNFLMEEHTLKHIRDFRLSPLLHGLDAKGVHINPQTAALKAYVDIDQNHHPEPLSKPILDELDRILASAEKTARELM